MLIKTDKGDYGRRDLSPGNATASHITCTVARRRRKNVEESENSEIRNVVEKSVLSVGTIYSNISLSPTVSLCLPYNVRTHDWKQ